MMTCEHENILVPTEIIFLNKDFVVTLDVYQY